MNQRQLWDTALTRSLPALARYVVAEGLTAEAASADPRGFAVSVARSEGWPDWLRLLLTRPLAYRAALDLKVPREPLAELAESRDHATALWANYALAEGSAGDKSAGGSPSESRGRGRLRPKTRPAPRPGTRRQSARGPTPGDSTRPPAWLRRNHPGAAALWSGWTVNEGRLVPSRDP